MTICPLLTLIRTAMLISREVSAETRTVAAFVVKEPVEFFTAAV